MLADVTIPNIVGMSFFGKMYASSVYIIVTGGHLRRQRSSRKVFKNNSFENERERERERGGKRERESNNYVERVRGGKKTEKRVYYLPICPSLYPSCHF